MSEQRYYEIVAEELQRKFLRPGLWARAVAETGGEGETARALYIRLRVSELIQIEQADRARSAVEVRRRAAEEGRAKKLRREAEMRAREEEERRHAQDQETERLRLDTERAASPYFGLVFIGGVITLLVLSFVVARVLSR